jgi:hypothetical protein
MGILSAIIMENEGLSLNDLTLIQRMALKKVYTGRLDTLEVSEKEERVLDSLVDLGLLDMGYDITPEGERAARLIDQYSKREREDLKAAKQLAAEMKPDVEDMPDDDDYMFTENEKAVMKAAGLNEDDMREVFNTQRLMVKLEENYQILPDTAYTAIKNTPLGQLKEIEQLFADYHKKNGNVKWLKDMYDEIKAEVERRENGEPEEMEVEDEYYDEPEDQFRDDVEADADALASAGWGEDEAYGYYGDDEGW